MRRRCSIRRAYLILFQPIYQFAVRNTLKTFPLTAAGWEAELYQASV